MTAALLLLRVYKFVQNSYTLIFLPGLHIETKIQRGLPFILDLYKKKEIFALKIAEKGTAYLNKA